MSVSSYACVEVYSVHLLVSRKRTQDVVAQSLRCVVSASSAPSPATSGPRWAVVSSRSRAQTLTRAGHCPPSEAASGACGWCCCCVG